jgi:tight adherence protein B
VTVGLIAAVLGLTLTLLVVTTGVLQDNVAYRRRLLAAVDAAPTWRTSPLHGLDDRLRRTRWGSRLAALLNGSGLVGRSPSGFLLVVSGATALAMVVTYPLVGRVGAVLVGVTVVVSVRRWLDRRREARIERFVSQLPELARLLANGASAGLGVRRSIELAAREMDEPAATELTQVSSELGLGQQLDTVLQHLSERLPSRELLVLVQTLIIQSRSGGALVTALSNIAATLDERRQLRREIRTAVVGAAFSGYAVILIGIGSIFLMNLLSPGALDAMFGTFLGQLALLAAGLLFAVGFLLIRRLTRVEL